MSNSNPGPTVAIIPARGGSKGIKGKNIRQVAGLPLLAHSVKHAVEAAHVDTCYVSTDDQSIAEVAQQFGAKIIHRPAEISGDVASSESALTHALEEIRSGDRVEPGLVVFLQCTSPVRTAADLDRAIDTLRAENADSLISVAPFHRFTWEITANGAESTNYDYKNRQRRQDLPTQYVENGSIYIFKPWVLDETNNRLGGRVAAYVMGEHTSFEIDSEFDLQLVDYVMSHHTGGK